MTAWMMMQLSLRFTKLTAGNQAIWEIKHRSSIRKLVRADLFFVVGIMKAVFRWDYRETKFPNYETPRPSAKDQLSANWAKG
ncbi:hypothetical protein N7451_001247 [Penicillium sp. IBT 35674x]|nr:hypothetical protein N7451_001247 [Penicillium sp. IBT 35674x]